MLWPPPALAAIVVSGVLLAVIIAITAYRQRPDPMAIPVALVMTAAAAWALPAGIGYAAADLEFAIRAEQLRYIGTVLAPLSFYLLAMRYTGKRYWLRRRIVLFLSIVPAITLALALTNPTHHLLWENPRLLSVVGGSIIVTDPGPWFPIHVAWSYGLMIVSLSLLGREVIRTDPFNRHQAGALFLGGLAPFLTNIGLQLGIAPGTDLDLTPLALAISGAIFAVALFRFDLIELGPIARSQVIEEIPDGVIVIDRSGTIREFNAVAGEMLEGIGRGRRADAIIPAAFSDGAGGLSVTVDGESKQYRCDRQPFHDDRGQVIGELLYLRDVSAVVRREQRISVLNRVLRHNIRNELMVQLGHLELLRDETADRDSHIETISESIHRVQDFADQARLIDRTLREPAPVTDIEIDPVIEEAIASITGDYPDRSLEWVGNAPGITVQTIDRELLAWVISELIENAIVHGPDDDGAITIDVTVGEETVEIAVIDNGAGVPESEIDAIQSTVETALDHGSGVGLWLARWTAQRSDGSLEFEERSERNAVCLTLPRV